MTGVLLLAGRVKASLFLSAYKSLVKNHRSPGSISLSFLFARAKKCPGGRKWQLSRSSAHSLCCFNWCLRNKSQRESKSIHAGCLCLCASSKSHSSCFFPPIFRHPFCKHYALNGNHGNKRDLYDKICCMCVKT